MWILTQWRHVFYICNDMGSILYYQVKPKCSDVSRSLNSLRLRQNGRHFADDTFKCSFLNENIWISINISLTFVPKGQINNISALVQIMAWRRPGDKPLSEPMMASLLTHICVTQPHTLWPIQTGCDFAGNVSLMKKWEFWLKFHWSLFPRTQSTRSQHWFR